jgi:cation diffusion facilitator family transporter
MHAHDLSPWNHSHDFDAGSAQGERALRWVLAITLATMVLEIVAGTLTGSLALTADGWHMGTHAAAFSVSLYAYWLARKHRDHTRYAWGTWKIEVLGGFASSVALGIVALMIAAEAVQRLLQPQALQARDALIVAVIGLAVNLLSALLLKPPHAHHDAEEHAHDHDDHHDHDHVRDHNLHAAFAHVLADVATSVAAIIALAGAWLWGVTWLDPLIGLAASIVIAVWAVGLMRSTARVLLDAEMDDPMVARVRDALQSDGDAKLADLHIWRVGRNRFALIATLVADAPRSPNEYRASLAHLPGLAHVSIEVNRCPGSVTHPHS